MNSINITGRLTKDPEIRYLETGKAVASVSIADNQKVKGEAVAVFFDLTLWDKRAEFAAQHWKKGDTVSVAGKMGPPFVKGEKAYLKVEVLDCTFALGAKKGEPATDGDFPF